LQIIVQIGRFSSTADEGLLKRSNFVGSY